MSKTIIITGASSGFGKETAKIFQEQGWNVVATMRLPENEEELNRLEKVWVTRMDVQDPGSVQYAVNEAIQRFGRIDLLVNNAGYGLMGVFESATPEQIRKQYSVNVFGLMDVTRAVLPQMRQQGNGIIINISSFGGQVGLPFGSLYNSSKFAVEGFSESLSHELSALGISVKIIEPGGVATNFRNGLDMIQNEIPVYNPLIGNFFGRYAGATAHLPKATPENVAQKHVSETEKLALLDCVRKIEQECDQHVDKHTQTLIQNNIEMLLNYCSRFYDRQFYTREKVSTDVVQAFEKLLKDHFAQDTLINTGLPGVKSFADRLHLSPNYLSDLLQKFTGKTTQEHIHLQLIAKAKALLWSTGMSISEIAYTLGFEHPPHFTRLFRQKTGYSPSEYRNLS